MMVTLPTNVQLSSRIIIDDWERTLRTNFQPSRSRRLPAVLETAAAGAQRSGIPIPSFLPRGITPTQALDIAGLIDPFGRTLQLKLSTRDSCNFKRVVEQPRTIKSTRHQVIRELTHLAVSIMPMRDALRKVSDKRPTANRLHIPLISFLVAKLNYPGRALPMDLTRGMKITGAIPASHVLASRVTSATKRMTALRDGLRRRNLNILRAIKTTVNTTLKAK